jgi:hypothetical protein
VFPSGAVFVGVTPTAQNSTWCRVSAGSANWRAPWTVTILPFLEQGALESQFNLNSSFMADDFSVPLPNGAPENMVPIPTFQCSSSRIANPLRNNYFGVQGGGDTPACTDGGTGTRQFFINGVLYANSRISTAHIRDGTSNVLLLGETKWCTREDGDGFLPAGFPEFCWQLPGKVGSQAIPFQVAGMSLPLNAAVPVAGSRMTSYGTRGFGSDHPGGATFGRADGSVHFISDTVSHFTLQNMAMRSDGNIDQVIP